jgi:hypothetical protein
MAEKLKTGRAAAGVGAAECARWRRRRNREARADDDRITEATSHAALSRR